MRFLPPPPTERHQSPYSPPLYASCISFDSVDTSLSLRADKYPIAIALPSSDNLEKKTEILVPSKISFSVNMGTIFSSFLLPCKYIIIPQKYCVKIFLLT